MDDMDDITLPPVECTRCGAHAPDPSSKEADAWEVQMLSIVGTPTKALNEDNAAMVLWCPQCAATPIDPEQEVAGPALQVRASYARSGPQRPGDLSGDNLIDDLIRLHMQGDKLDDMMRAILAEQLQQDLRVVWVMDYQGVPDGMPRRMFITEATIVAAVLRDN
jgi:hypothetical protein